jgi:hypothetical protein
VKGWGLYNRCRKQGGKIEGWRKIEHDMVGGGYDMIPRNERHMKKADG